MHKLRRAGVAAEQDTMGRSLKAQMKYADRIGARYCAVLGDDELDAGEVKIKDMTTGTAEPCALSVEAIASYIKQK